MSRAEIRTNGRGLWFSAVWSGDTLIVSDNGTDRIQLTDQARYDVVAVDRIEQMGHQLTKDYRQIVDEVTA